MALNPGQLKNQIQGVFDQRLGSIQKIASRIARAYQSYAAAAQAPPGAPVVLKGTESRLLEEALINLMQARLPAPAAAQAIGVAVTSFWMLPPVLTSIGGVATTIVPAAGVAKLISTNVNNSSDAAQSLANSLDLMTRTVFVVNIPPVPPGLIF